MNAIPSPYYFVPLSERVFWPEDSPDWVGPVSHEMPFRDGLCGELEIEVEAMRPIYVRGHAEKPEAHDTDQARGYLRRFHRTRDTQPTAAEQERFDAWVSFCRENGRYVIPGTGIKGVIRNVLKIASFGSFREAASSDRYSVRDLSAGSPYQKRFVAGKPQTEIIFLAQAGWLTRSGEAWVIHPCDHYHRVEQEDLCVAFGGVTKRDFANTQTSPNSVAEKYQRWERAGHILDITFRADAERNWHKLHPPKGNRRFELPLKYRWATAIKAGSDCGTLVFTGQPSGDKHMEFIFEQESACRARNRAIPLTEDQVREFLFVHEEHESEAWQFWRPKFNRNESVPVFWLKPRPGEAAPNGLRAFGLAQLFRYPADRTLSDGIFPEHLDPKKHDLADLIFGTLTGDGLRGRAAFTSFKAERTPVPLPVVWTVLGSPKPTFYPNYLEQEYDPQTGKLIEDYNPQRCRNESRPYRTLMSERIQLRGWKRYAVQSDSNTCEPLPPEHNFTNREPPSFESATAFAALPAGTKFVGELRFHNLRPAELGALVWAIEWGGDGDLRHLVGMGKGMGLGSVKMTIPNRVKIAFEKLGKPEGKVTLDEARHAFVDAMTTFKPNWASSDPISELKLLANEKALSQDQAATVLRYPKLEVGGSNEFVEAKKREKLLVLRSYGEVTGKHSRSPWDPNLAPVPAASPEAEEVTECHVILVAGQGGKLRAQERGAQSSYWIANREAFPSAAAGACWRAKKLGTPANPSYTLIAPVPDA